MKIAFDYQTFCLQSYGGISRYFVRLAEGVLSKGEDLAVFSPCYKNKYLSSLSDSVIQGRSVNCYPSKTARLALYLNYVIGKRSIQKWRPQIVHETYYARKSSAPIGCPVVITIHDMIPELYNHKDSNHVKAGEIKRIAVERANHIICISECTKKDLVRIFDVPKNKISVVYHGFEKFRFIPNVQDQGVEKKPFILYVGNRNGYKNFSRFLQSIAVSERLITDFRVLAFGGGAFSKKDQSQIHELGFKDGQVMQVGGSDNVLAELYDEASAFVFPSLYEGFGLPPLEAMAHKCPVISSNSSCMPEILGEAAEFFNPNSIDEMTIAIENVLYSNERTIALKTLGVERLRKFSWQKCATDTLSVYQKVLDDKF